ncbi:hypothetical protein OESDEN_00234 [Oesophagostomum dentatum]|uniref:Uncharacterized protein n=1 Tax=Oesophagostomum dentatum TaxID=61180 RepID=A0A0B1TR91_OESDE|nr:hypothetical protein OESDEN_00234 [Oesophagostomum dentatum]
MIKGVSLCTKSTLTSSMNTAKLSPADKRFIRKEMTVVAQTSLEKKRIIPDILVGQDLIDKFLLRDQPCVSLPSGLILTPTIFDVAISRRTLSVQGKHHQDTQKSTDHTKEQHKQDIKNLYELKSLGIKLIQESDEELVLKLM